MIPNNSSIPLNLLFLQCIILLHQFHLLHLFDVCNAHREPPSKGRMMEKRAAATILCSKENPCHENKFCSFNATDNEGQTIGYCEECFDHPSACTYPELTTSSGEADCKEKCTKTKHCTDDDPCTKGGDYFCNYYRGDKEGGLCEVCNDLPDLTKCNNWGLPEKGAMACNSTCVLKERTCSLHGRCPYG